ncbi:MAG: hypothetical protein ACRDZ3_15645 [Acidimicrobiia bacterium]
MEGTDGGGVVTGEVLWKIRSESGVQQSVFEVGETPDGFSVVAPATASLPATGELAVTVKTTRFEGSIDVDPGQVDLESVQTGEKSVSREEFDLERDC